MLPVGTTGATVKGKGLKICGTSGIVGVRREETGERAGADVEVVKLLGVGLTGSVRVGAGVGVVAMAAARSCWMMAGFSKSHDTPCFTQLPHLG